MNVFQVDDEDKSFYIQFSQDRPGVASTFGWAPCHGETDGTTDCPTCGKSADDLISEATQFLDDNEGKQVEDPGYFNGDD